MIVRPCGRIMSRSARGIASNSGVLTALSPATYALASCITGGCRGHDVTVKGEVTPPENVVMPMIKPGDRLIFVRRFRRMIMRNPLPAPTIIRLVPLHWRQRSPIRGIRPITS